jgi:glycosyltransferase involved in cell wall biosynthesis
MRILIANWNRNVVGGTEKYLQAILSELHDRGHEVALLYERKVDPSRETVDADTPGASAWCTGEMGIEKVLGSVSEWGPQIVYSHGLESAELEGTILRTYPTVLFAHNYYGTCGTGSKCHSFPVIEPCSRRFGPSCLLFHYTRRCGGLNPVTTFKVFRRQAQRGAGLAKYRAIVVGSRHMQLEIVNHGVNPGQVHLAPLPLTEAPGDFSNVPARPEGRVLMLGRLTTLKGGEHLIRAMAQASRNIGHLSLVVVGDGPEQPRLEQLARALGVPAEFSGWLRSPEKRAQIGRADLLAVPSLWPEPFGLAGIEAGSLGVPAVGYAVGGIPEWLIPGYSGELAPGDPPSIDGLAQAIVRALRDPEHYDRLRIGAIEVSKRFTMKSHMDKLDGILNLRNLITEQPSRDVRITAPQ